jgi:AraC-like DNA-binding protein
MLGPADFFPARRTSPQSPELRGSDSAACSTLSRSAFAARFRERMGTAPAAYLVGLRMARASVLLRDEGSMLAAVAVQVGYGSEAAFSAAFKRFTGMAPGAFRRHNPGIGHEVPVLRG